MAEVPTCSSPRLALRVVGCKVNQCEAEAIGQRLAADGWDRGAVSPDLVWVHTCTVTARADRDSRRAIERAHGEHPTAAIVVSGCLAELEGERLTRLPGVRVVVRTTDRERTAEIARQVLGRDAFAVSERDTKRERTGPVPGRSRAFVKIEDGCDGTCTYCRVRLARGPVVSRPLAEVLDEVRDLAAAGSREIVLTGVNVGAWRPGLPVLLDELADLPQGVRLRLSSLEPQHLTQELIAAWAKLGARLCPHLHLALQSGDDAVLRAMGRTYTAADVRARVAALRSAVPELVLTADVITGFPGETEAEFECSRELVVSLGCTRLHVFPFSPRPGTPAAAFPGQHLERVRTQRARALRAFGAELGRRHRASLAGKRVTVLLEGRPRDGVWQGTTEGYDQALVRTAGKAGDLVNGRVKGTDGERLLVEL